MPFHSDKSKRCNNFGHGTCPLCFGSLSAKKLEIEDRTGINIPGGCVCGTSGLSTSLPQLCPRSLWHDTGSDSESSTDNVEGSVESEDESWENDSDEFRNNVVPELVDYRSEDGCIFDIPGIFWVDEETMMLEQGVQNNATLSVGSSDETSGNSSDTSSDDSDSAGGIVRDLANDDGDVDRMELDTSEDSVLSSEDDDGVQSQSCANCRRSEVPAEVQMDMPCAMNLSMYNPTGIKTRGAWSCLRVAHIRGANEVVLCTECASFLIEDRDPSPSTVWPSFLWKLLTNRDLFAQHGCNLWAYIPDMWRYWWIGNVAELDGVFSEYHVVTVSSPVSIFRDVTFARNAMKRSVEELRLADLVQTMNKYMFPTVRCPWGCTEYYHKAPSLDFASVYLRFLGPLLKVPRWSTETFVRGVREDYIDSVDYLLMNPCWPITPCVIIAADGCPYILACREHAGGSKWDYIHPPRNPNGMLPCKHSDQNAHAVVMPRTISPMKAKAYSTTFQMHEMRGSFVGLDTLSLVDHGRHDYTSIIARADELVSFCGRADIRGLMSRHAATGVIPSWLAAQYETDAAIERSLNLSVDGDVLSDSLWQRSLHGSTFVPYEDCIRLQRYLDTPGAGEVTVFDDARVFDDSRFQEGDTVRAVPVRPPWRADIVRAHSVDSYGARIARIPAYNVPDVDTRCLWVVVSMLSSIPSFWRATVKSVKRTSEWQGWVLARTMRDCFRRECNRVSKNNPFHLKTTIRKAHDSVACGSLHTFDRNNFMVQLRLVQNVASVWFEDLHLLGDISNNNILEGKHCIVVVRHDRDGGVADDTSVLPSQLEVGESNHWELRYVAVTSGDAMRAHRWSGHCFVRHGGRQFPCWWKHSRGARGAIKVDRDGPVEEDFSSWDVAVYVKAEPADFGTLRDAYFGYIGGQPNNYCDVHDKPLIAAINRKGHQTRCTCRKADGAGSCGKIGYLCCTEVGCRVTVCRVHAVSNRGSLMRFTVYRENTDPDSDSDISQDPSVSVDEENDDGFGICTDNDDEDDQCGSNAKEEVQHGSANSCDDDESNDGTVFSRLSVDGDLQCTQAFVVDDEVDPHDLGDNVVHEGDAYAVHFTNAARNTTPIWCAKTYISGHIVLNAVGSCLIRRDRPIRPRRYQAAFLERMVSTSEGHSVPLVYPEAMMYPSIFWKDASDGSQVGSIPSSLLNDCRHCNGHGFASLTDHLRARLTNPSLRTSTDPRYIFHAFDCFANLNLRGEDSRVVLSRGFVENKTTGGVRANNSDHFNTDSIDSRPVVNKLSAAIAEEPATYFYTQSCNQKEFYGVRELKRWIDSTEFRDQLLLTYPHLSKDEHLEFVESMVQASCVPIVRNWMEIAEIHMLYMSKSPERPLGKVTKIWWRHEFQGEKGNLSHIHCLLWTDDTDEETILNRIRGSVADLIRPDEIEPLLAEGYFSDMNDIDKIREFARRFLFHHCDRRCLRRTGPGDNDLKCRVPAAIMLNPTYNKHTRVVIEPHHTSACLDVLKDLGLCHEDSGTDRFLPLHNSFVSERCYPPAMPAEGTMSPTNGRVFAYTSSQSNVQRTTGYFSSRYLAKYVAGIDEGNKVSVAAGNDCTGGPQHVTPELVLHTELYHAPKVTGSKINIEKREKKQKKSKYPDGRALAITEAVVRLLGYSQIYTNLQFEVLATTAMAERPGYDRVAPGSNDERVGSSRGPSDLIAANHIASVTARQSLRLPPWRYLTRSEKMLLLDNLYSPVTVDKTTVFGVRPPELRFVMSQALYYKWFVREGSVKGEAALALHLGAVKTQYAKTQWVDGFNSRIRVRLKALPSLIAYANGVGGTPRACREILRLMTILEQYCVWNITLQRDRVIREEFMQRFVVDDGDAPLPTIVFSNIKPTKPQPFLLHVALSLGEFSNEVELFGNSTDVRDIFQHARLFNPSDAEGSTKHTIRRYIVEQLVHLPGGTKMFDRLCVSAYFVLYEAMVRGNILLQEMPSVLYTSLQVATCEKVRSNMFDLRKNLAAVTLADLRRDVAHAGLPSADVIAACTKRDPLNPPLQFGKATIQSQESYDEQQAALAIATSKLQRYLHASRTLVKSYCVVGGPGVGKTALLRLIMLKAMSMGLTVMLTTLMSERAFQLGGVHVHKFLRLPVREKGTVQRIAELALMAIYKCPEAFAMIVAQDVLFVDEFGQLSDAHVAIFDIIYRVIRSSTAFMGGVVVVSTMDWKQLKPIQGLPAMLSPSMITSFNFYTLTESVRAGGDRNFQRIQVISRLDASEYTTDIINEFKNLLRTYCTFIPTWDNPILEQSIIRVFGLLEAVRHAEKTMLTRIQRSNVNVIESLARDEQMSVTGHSDWTSASEPICKQLDKKCKECRHLHFYPRALYEMTYNDPVIGFSQSQIAILRQMPTADEVDAFQPVSMLLAPAGCKAMPDGIVQVDDLIDHGWKPVMVGVIAIARVHTFSHGIRGRRLQYGFRHRIAATIHAVMGSDFNKLITSVSTTDSRYRLWEKEQVVVLLSRTFQAQNTIFVGDKEDTITALARTIQNRTQYTEYISHLLATLCGSSRNGTALDAPFVRNDIIPFRPIDIQLPQEGSGYCYIIVSLQDMGTTYIGQTMSLVHRLNQHNRGVGSQQTADPKLRPWSLISFVCGFDGDRHLMLRFESDWERRRENMLASGAISSPEQIADVARMVMTEWNEQGIVNDLRYVLAGTFMID